MSGIIEMMIEPVRIGEDVTLYHGDCVEVMKQFPDGSIDALIVDEPYFEVAKADWDNQWATRDDYLDWICEQAKQWKRILKDNSSIFVFCDEKMEAYIQVRLDEYFLLLNKIVWYRKTNEMRKFAQNFRNFAPATERALFYTTQYDPTGWETIKLDVNNFMSLREYFREFQEALGMSKKQIIERIGQKADHAFRFNSTQWDLPTSETYRELIELNPNHGFIPREYETLRQEYETLRRPFNADNNTFDVLEFPAYDNTSGKIDHLTPKPFGLMRRIISVITNPGQIVLDCCMGSGTTIRAAQMTNRKAIGIEKDAHYFDVAVKRCSEPVQKELV